MASLLARTLTGLSLLLVTACGAVRTGDYIEPYQSDATSRSPFLWQGRAIRRWVRVSAKSSSTIWPALESSLDRTTPLEGRDNVVGSMGSYKGLPSFVFVLLTGSLRLSPVGPAGTSLTLTAGTHVLHRRCTAEQPNDFVEIDPSDSAIDYRAATNAIQEIDPYLEACGLPYAPAIDLGRKVGGLPAQPGGAVPVVDLAWAPTSDAVYLLGGTLISYPVRLLKFSVGASSLEQIAWGDYHLPLEVTRAGRVLVNEVSWSGDVNTGDATFSVRRLSLSWQGSAQMTTAILPLSTLGPIGARPLGVMSPDGTILAYGRPDGWVDLVDLSSNAVLPTSPGMGIPLAWDPSGQRLLVWVNLGIVWLGLDGSQEKVTSILVSNRFLPANGAQDRVFWGASGPKLLRQDADGTQLVDLPSGSSIRFVEPDRVAAPGAMLGFAAATEQVFAWAVQCLGLGETACTSELRRLTLATGIIDVVARADGPLPFAVSPDGRQLALAYEDGLYLKTIAP